MNNCRCFGSDVLQKYRRVADLVIFFLQVKRRLDYQLATANVLRAAEQKHMVQWIIDNVRKSITAKQEADALKACVADLKALAK